MYVKYLLDDRGTGHVFKREKVLVEESSEYQTIEISELEILGKVLALDGIIQLSQLDSDRYHEAFAHIPVSNTSDCTRFLILGGGDGILAKELLKYEGVTVDMVDIDKRVCELSRIHLSDLNENSFESDRLNLHNMCALDFCENAFAKKIKYDVIFADITDPHPNSPSKSLLSDSAITLYKGLLKKKGIFVAQTDNIQIAPHHADGIKNILKRHFYNVGDYGIVALTLSSVFSFVYASNSIIIQQRPIQVKTNWLNEERFNLCLNILDTH